MSRGDAGLSSAALAPAGVARPDGSSAPVVALRGTLDDLSLFDALTLVAATRTTGVLRVGGPFAGSVHVVAGRIGCVRCEGSASWGDVLSASGAVGDWDVGDEPAVDQLLLAVADRQRLETVVRDHLVDLLFELAVLGEGAIEFVAPVPDPWGGCLTVDLAVATAEHERRVAEWREIAASLPPMTATPQLAPRLAPGVEEAVVSNDEWRVLAALDGTTTLAGVVGSCGLGPLETCRALHGLLRKGLVHTDAG